MAKITLIVSLIICLIIDISAQKLIPKFDGEVIKHKYYTLSYNENHELPNWVFYFLTDDLAFGAVDRKDAFRPDPMVSTGTAIKADYEGSGYDRGHMCPAEAMSFDSLAMSESFYFSNMSPQSGSLNRGKWKSLETSVRNWAKEKGGIYVVTGPIFKNIIGVIGPNAVTVPGYYYKIIYNPGDEGAMIAFSFPNEKANKSLENYIVAVNWIEDLTGIDFFESMDDDKEEILESISDPALWGLSGQIVTFAQVSESKNVQCNAITKKGERCKRKSKEGSDYCWQHQK